MVFVVKLDVAGVLSSDRNVWHFEAPSCSDESILVPTARYRRNASDREMDRPAGRSNRVGLLSSPPKNNAYDPIKLHIENGLVRIFAGWAESCFICCGPSEKPSDAQSQAAVRLSHR